MRAFQSSSRRVNRAASAALATAIDTCTRQRIFNVEETTDEKKIRRTDEEARRTRGRENAVFAGKLVAVRHAGEVVRAFQMNPTSNYRQREKEKYSGSSTGDRVVPLGVSSSNFHLEKHTTTTYLCLDRRSRRFYFTFLKRYIYIYMYKSHMKVASFTGTVIYRRAALI